MSFLQQWRSLCLSPIKFRLMKNWWSHLVASLTVLLQHSQFVRFLLLVDTHGPYFFHFLNMDLTGLLWMFRVLEIVSSLCPDLYFEFN